VTPLVFRILDEMRSAFPMIPTLLLLGCTVPEADREERLAWEKGQAIGTRAFICTVASVTDTTVSCQGPQGRVDLPVTRIHLGRAPPEALRPGERLACATAIDADAQLGLVCRSHDEP
jgi:hypothetical protein